MTFSAPDYLVIAAYTGIILFIGFYISRHNGIVTGSSTEDFLLAGRKVTLPIFVGTLVATWYGNILGVGEFIYNDGIAEWFSFAFPYYIAAIFFAFFVAQKIRNSNVTTIPEQVEKKYGRAAGYAASVLVLIITIPAAYILMMGIIVQLFLGWELWLCIVIGALISLAYIYTGGFRADILTNAAQFVIMYIGFAALLYFSVKAFGTPSEMISKLPESHRAITGNHDWQYILVWFIIAFQTFVDPTFHQRCAAAKNPKTARNGILISVFFWAVFDLMTLATGLYATAYLNISAPVDSFPALAEAVLPPFWKGVFMVTLLATIMSTLDSYSFVSAMTFGNDIFRPILKKFGVNSSYFSTERLTKAGLILTAAIGIILAIILPSPVELIYKLSSIAVPGLLVPLLLTYSSRTGISKNKIIIIMAVSSSVSFIWTILNSFAIVENFPEAGLFLNIEPMIPGILISVVLGVIFVIFSGNKANEKY